MRGNRTAPCEVCGKDYVSWTHQRRRFCSRACRGVFERTANGSLLQRLLDHIAVTDGHWLWQGRPGKRGYGRISVDGKVTPTHQAAWVAVSGPIPDGLLVCHTCDIRICIRNDDEGTYEIGDSIRPRRGHLWLGTNAENMLDKMLKGRATGPGLVGVAHPNALLTEAIVREARALRATGWTMEALGRHFGVKTETIGSAIRRRNWAHVE